MLLTIVTIIASLFLSLNGLLYQPKKNVQGPATLKNINSTGKLLFGLILLLTSISIYKTITDNIAKDKEIEENKGKINALLSAQEDLKTTNNYLIKVMS